MYTIVEADDPTDSIETDLSKSKHLSLLNGKDPKPPSDLYGDCFIRVEQQTRLANMIEFPKPNQLVEGNNAQAQHTEH